MQIAETSIVTLPGLLAEIRCEPRPDFHRFLDFLRLHGADEKTEFYVGGINQLIRNGEYSEKLWL